MLHQASISFMKIKNDHIELRNPSILDRNSMRTYNLMDNIPYSVKSSFSISPRKCQSIQYQQVKCTVNVNPEELADEDEELCPVECVREIKKDVELLTVLEKAKQNNALVVVDFYRTSCGSCKYIAQGFAKLCKGSGNEDAAVVFLKHNVIDEYDEESEIAERLRIKTVPLFHFYKNGILLEAFPTRDKERIKAAILKYTAPAAQNV